MFAYCLLCKGFCNTLILGGRLFGFLVRLVVSTCCFGLCVVALVSCGLMFVVSLWVMRFGFVQRIL